MNQGPATPRLDVILPDSPLTPRVWVSEAFFLPLPLPCSGALWSWARRALCLWLGRVCGVGN